MYQQKLDEIIVEGKRLGRHIQHDPRSKSFPFAAVPLSFDDLKTVVHRHYGPVLDQGNLGSCTGNAIAQACNTLPTHATHTRLLVEKDAVNIYAKATVVDEWEGQYPPDDTGSSGLAVCKVAKRLNLITEYQHAFSVESAVLALQERPVITGIGWREGCDVPDDDGMVTIDGQLRGGHEIVAVGFHIPAHAKSITECVVEFINSWSKYWGHRGRFFMWVKDWAALLDDDGDVTVPIR